MPFSARAREGAPVAAPVAWDELDDFESAHHFSIRDADELLDRAGSKALAGWGQGEAILAGCITLSVRAPAARSSPHRRRPADPVARRGELKAEAARVTIIRDDWGIAHVHGKTDADAVFGMIYAQAEDDFPRIEANY